MSSTLSKPGELDKDPHLLQLICTSRDLKNQQMFWIQVLNASTWGENGGTFKMNLSIQNWLSLKSSCEQVEKKELRRALERRSKSQMWVHMCTNTRRPWYAALTHTYARTHTQHTHSRPNPIKLACGIRVRHAMWLWVFARHPQCATADSKILVLSATFVVIVVGDSVSSPSCNVLRPGKETRGRGASCRCLFMCQSSAKSFGAR